jgi:hypothetical protein
MSNEFRRQLIETASWRIVTELMRRYPNELYVFETHPAIYDCLSIYDIAGRHLADFNRLGTFHNSVGDLSADGMDIWSVMLDEGSTLTILNRICSTLNLHPVNMLPASNMRVKTYKFIADWVALKSFDIHEYRVRNGYYFIGEHRSWTQEDYFGFFPEANERLRVSLKDDHLRTPSTRFWFLMRGSEVIACVETSGLFWSRDGFSSTIDKVDIRRIG